MYLTFSDSAKFADIARNLVNGLGYGGKFDFWSVTIFGLTKAKIFPWFSTPPIMPLSIAAFFKIFGITDFAVIATSFFYFILTLIFVFLLARKIFDRNLIGVLSTLAVGFNYSMINYATTGASESPFIFEIVAASYFASIQKGWGNILTILLLISMYFTRPQAFIYIAGIILYWLLLNFKSKKALFIFGPILITGLLVDYFILSRFPETFVYSVTGRGLSAASQIVSGGSASDSLRGNIVAPSGILTLAKKIFYNLYNFYKLLPQIINPYLFTLFIIGLIKLGKHKFQNSFRFASFFIVLVTFLVTAASIPFFRYIHPIIPFVYIIAVDILVWLLAQLLRGKILVIVSTLLILFFAVGQTLGILFLDSRFEANTHNVGKPPVYAQLSYFLRDNTNENQTIITNLDTWGSWYGERKTIWFPLEPKQLIDTSGTIPFDGIYLTSYLIDDQNYYMGSDWREIFNNPTDSKKWICDGCGEIAKEFKFKGIYKITAYEDYERQETSAILLIKK